MNEEHLSSGQAVVGTTPSLIAPYNADRTSITIANNGDATIYIGGVDVESRTGYVLQVGQTVTIASQAAFYGVVQRGMQRSSYLERLP